MNNQTNLSNIEMDLMLKTKAFSEFYEKVMDPEMKTPFTAEAISALKCVAQVSPSGVDLAVEQVKIMGSYLRNRLLPGSVLISLACGLHPANPEDLASDAGVTLTGETVPLHHSDVRSAAWISRRWAHAEENVGLVDPVDFFTWCDETEIDTNYLRLMRELMACGATREMGVLPLGKLVKFGFSF
jgi:hypothetical protein